MTKEIKKTSSKNAIIAAVLAALGIGAYLWWVQPTPQSDVPPQIVAMELEADIEDPKPMADDQSDVADAGAVEPKVPTFDLVRVEPGGSTIIAGTAPDAGAVQLVIDGQELPGAEAVVGSDGKFVIVTQIAPSQVPQMLELSTVVDESVAPMVSDQRVFVAVPIVETVADPAPAPAVTNNSLAVTEENKAPQLESQPDLPVRAGRGAGPLRIAPFQRAAGGRGAVRDGHDDQRHRGRRPRPRVRAGSRPSRRHRAGACG